MFKFGDQYFEVLPCGALWWAERNTLIVADLHLEKGSSFAKKGQLIPPYDTRKTLKKLGRTVERYRPKMLLALGDSFHDDHASGRLSDVDRANINKLAEEVEFVWIEGNHDPSPPVGVLGRCVPNLVLDEIEFRHEPRKSTQLQMFGHLHPSATIRKYGRSVRRHCVVQTENSIVLAAYGAYAGGLSVNAPPFRDIISPGSTCLHVLGNDQVYPISYRNAYPHSKRAA